MESSKGPPKYRPVECIAKGPGPKYGLLGLTGYQRHDPTRRVEPAYTIRERKFVPHYNVNPGPNKYALFNLTSRGMSNAPAYTVGVKPPYRVRDTGPGPANYQVDLVNRKSSPAYTMRLKFKEKIGSAGPGPNTALPTCIGPNIPDKRAMAAYSMAFSKPKQVIDDIPGPAQYSYSIDTVKKKSPAYGMRFKHRTHKPDDIPGPKYDAKIPGRRAPTYAFGIKHSQCAILPMTPEDEF